MAAAAKQARKRSDDRTARTEAEQRHADRQIGQVVPDSEREQARQRDLECQQSRGGEEDRRIQADMRLRPPAFHDDRPGYDRRLRGGEFVGCVGSRAQLETFNQGGSPAAADVTSSAAGLGRPRTNSTFPECRRRARVCDGRQLFRNDAAFVQRASYSR
jgi:hypothetical protein